MKSLVSILIAITFSVISLLTPSVANALCWTCAECDGAEDACCVGVRCHSVDNSYASCYDEDGNLYFSYCGMWC